MSTEHTKVFKKENLDRYLNELAKEYKKETGGKMPAEIILIGGAAVLEGYGFREMTADIDAIINASSAMKEAVNRVGDRFDLPNGWLNTDFQKTKSYSDKLIRCASFYKTFCQILNVRIVTGAYLVAMKLCAFRPYKNDLSDVIGILAEHEKRGDGLRFEQIDQAVTELYGSWDRFPEGAKDFILNAFSDGRFDKAYAMVQKNEREAKTLLLDYQKEYPDRVKSENIHNVLRKLQEKKKSGNK